MTPLFTLAALVGGSAAMALNVPAVSNARPAARAVVEAHGCHSRRSVFLLGVSALSLLVEMPVAAFAADADLASCRKDCFKECNALAPGNQAYCAQQCDDYCADAEVTGAADVLRSDPSSPSTENNLGIFGDSGVSYSKGVEVQQILQPILNSHALVCQFVSLPSLVLRRIFSQRHLVLHVRGPT
eukprot:6195068-Pleurochrysis_carterae.AAC.4